MFPLQVGSKIAIKLYFPLSIVSPFGKKIVFLVPSNTGINASKTLLEACCKLSITIIQLFKDLSLYFELSIASNNLLLEVLNSMLVSF